MAGGSGDTVALVVRVWSGSCADRRVAARYTRFRMRRPSPSLFLFVLASACPTPKPTRSPHATPGNLDACPDTFVAASGACDAENVECHYPRGSCSCTTGSYCGGVEPSPEMQAEMRKTRWVCRETPPAVRADGCPGVEPTQDAACLSEGQQCVYGDCCVIPASCVGGRWKVEGPQCPP